MEVMKIVLLAVTLLALGILGMAITILVKKNGKFPNTHVSGNKYLKSQGIPCAKAQDKIEQRKAWEKVKYKKATLVRK